MMTLTYYKVIDGFMNETEREQADFIGKKYSRADFEQYVPLTEAGRIFLYEVVGIDIELSDADCELRMAVAA